MFTSLVKTISASVLALLCVSAFAGTITVDSGVVFTGANGQDADPSNSITSINRAYFPHEWGSTFSTSATEGRVSSNGDFGLNTASDGFQFDAFNVDTTVNSAASGYTPSIVAFDRAGVQVQLNFTVTGATQYSIASSYSGVGAANNLSGGILAALVNLDTSTTLYLERNNASLDASFDYSLGDPDPAVRIGTNIGVIGPGQYRLIWETSTTDYLASNIAFAASGSADLLFQVGSFANVPEPSSLLLLSLGLLALISTSNRTRSLS